VREHNIYVVHSFAAKSHYLNTQSNHDLNPNDNTNLLILPHVELLAIFIYHPGSVKLHIRYKRTYG